MNNMNTLPAPKETWKNTWITLVVLILSFVATIAYFGSVYPQLPETCAIHWNAQSEIDGYGSKSSLMVAALLCPLIITIVFILCGVIMIYCKQQAVSDSYWQKPEHYNFILPFMINYLYLFGTAINIVSIFLNIPTWNYNILCVINPEHPVSCDYQMNMTIPLIFLALVIVLFLASLGFLCLVPKYDKNYTPEKNDNMYWVMYCIYFNPKDTRCFIPKRLGFGWTLNMGNTRSWIAMLGLLFFIVVIIVVTIMCI